jgi:bleomycin hydrolase
MARTKDPAVDPAWADARAASFARSRANRVARNAVTSMNVTAAARDVARLRRFNDTYTVSVKRTGKPTNQRRSGRCWLFSAYNVARAATMELLDVDDFEFSQAYGMFYDKLEKANALLEHVIDFAGRDPEDRELVFVLENAMGDGGYYSLAMNLIRKWGLVPKDAMPETACSKDSAQMDRQLDRLVHRQAAELLDMAKAGSGEEELRGRKQEMLGEVYQVLAVCLGEPPRTFDFSCEVGKDCKLDSKRLVDVLPAPSGDDADEKPRRMVRDHGLTPHTFLERYVPFDLDDYVDLIYFPGERRPFGTIYHVRLCDTVVGGKPLHMLNVEQDVLEHAAIASLEAGVPVSMSCDVMQDFPRQSKDFPGILTVGGVDAESLFGVSLSYPRDRMIDTHETCMTHAMTFQGVELDRHGRPVSWRVENSWGKEACKDGYIQMDAEWFRTFGGEVIVRREFVPDEVLEVWDTAKPQDVEPWSGMGRAIGRPRTAER